MMLHFLLVSQPLSNRFLTLCGLMIHIMMFRKDVFDTFADDDVFTITMSESQRKILLLLSLRSIFVSISTTLIPETAYPSVTLTLVIIRSSILMSHKPSLLSFLLWKPSRFLGLKHKTHAEW